MADDAALLLPGGREVKLAQPLTIGRGAGNALVLDDATVSRDHAVVRRCDGRWCIEDRGSFNGTFVNGVRAPARTPQPLRHCDRIAVGAVPLVFTSTEHVADPNATLELKPGRETDPAVLSPFQLQVVKELCASWIETGNLDSLPSNREIAEQLGTPEGEATVKAALRRVYRKAGLTGLPAQAKRRRLCRVARQRGWVSRFR
jgi:pSer/pThr/pTyr-binding forkhead associated (FHA) protein